MDQAHKDLIAELEDLGESTVRGRHAVNDWGNINGPKVTAWLFEKEHERNQQALRAAVQSAEASRASAKWAFWAAVAAAAGALATWVQIFLHH